MTAPPHPFKAYLEKKKLTQAQAARQAGVNPARLCDVLKGRHWNFSSTDARRLAKAFKDFPLEKFLWGRDPEENPSRRGSRRAA